MSEGEWRKGDKEAPSVLLRDRTIGLLGYGAVNRHLHEFISPLGPRVLALRRRWDEPESLVPDADRYTPSRLDSFLTAIDTLVIALPLTESTEGLIDEDALKRLGSDGLLVNIGRGPIVDESALYDALEGQRIMGAAIDVWYDYNPSSDADGRKHPYDAAAHPFHELPNVVLSPHRAASPFSDVARWDDVSATLKSIARGEVPRNVVDLDAGY